MRKIQLLLFGVSLISPAAVMANDYPTTLRVEYVLQCMAANGNKLEMLYKCSCSIDEIAQQVSVDTYYRRKYRTAIEGDRGRERWLIPGSGGRPK